MRNWSVLLICIVSLVSCAKERHLPLTEGGSQVKEIVVYPSETKLLTIAQKSLGASTHLLFGKVGTEYTARLLLKFGAIPDSVAVDSAQIILYTQNFFGDSSAASFSADLFPIRSDWDETTITDWTQSGVSFDSTQIYASALIHPVSNDTVIFNFDDVSLINQWISDSSTNHGVWIDCKNATFIKDFYSRAFNAMGTAPKFRLIFKKNDQTDTTAFVVALKDASVIIANLKIDEQQLYIGKGIAFSNLAKFDVAKQIDSIATINKAELQLVINREYSILNALGATDLRVRRISSESTDPKNITVDSTFSGYSGSVLVDTVYVNVRSLVQYWTARSSLYPNYGFLLQSINEDLSLARIAFYPSGVDSVRSPKLVIVYSLPPVEN